jgi:glycosyltransferase involved in cell wall biosynthesis
MPTAPHDASSDSPVKRDADGTLAMTVVIGTQDRSADLAIALDSLANQTCDPRRFEILVVDNGSRDGTRDLVAARQATMPNLRYVTEPVPGLSNARNRGIADARAEIVGFFDDDGEAEPDWATIVLDTFASSPDIDAVGGRIHARWPGGDTPDWMSSAIAGHYAICDYGPERRDISFPEYPFGPNMAIRRGRLQAIGGFRSELGPLGGNIRSCGETDLFYRLEQRPLRVVYEPRAVVHHRIPKSRATRAWLLKRAYRFGRSTSAMQFLNGGYGRLGWLKHLVAGSAQVGLAALATTVAVISRKSPAVVVSRASFVTYKAGFLRGALSNLFSPSDGGSEPLPADATGARQGGGL